MKSTGPVRPQYIWLNASQNGLLHWLAALEFHTGWWWQGAPNSFADQLTQPYWTNGLVKSSCECSRLRDDMLGKGTLVFSHGATQMFKGSPPPFSMTCIVQKTLNALLIVTLASLRIKNMTPNVNMVCAYLTSGKEPVIKRVTCYGNVSFLLLCDRRHDRRGGGSPNTYNVQYVF